MHPFAREWQLHVVKFAGNREIRVLHDQLNEVLATIEPSHQRVEQYISFHPQTRALVILILLENVTRSLCHKSRHRFGCHRVVVRQRGLCLIVGMAEGGFLVRTASVCHAQP